MKFPAHFPKIALTLCLGISACSVAKLEARLEADPQCRPIMNPKTGALMPCPGSDKAFYLAAGLGPAKNDLETPLGLSPSKEIDSKDVTLNTVGTSLVPNQNTRISTKVDCKSKIHQKTGGTLPCPSD